MFIIVCVTSTVCVNHVQVLTVNSFSSLVLVFARQVTGLCERDVSVTYYCKDQPWLLWKSGETGCAAQSETHILRHRLIVPSVYSTDISTYKHTLLILEL